MTLGTYLGTGHTVRRGRFITDSTDAHATVYFDVEITASQAITDATFALTVYDADGEVVSTFAPFVASLAANTPTWLSDLMLVYNYYDSYFPGDYTAALTITDTEISGSPITETCAFGVDDIYVVQPELQLYTTAATNVPTSTYNVGDDVFIDGNFRMIGSETATSVAVTLRDSTFTPLETVAEFTEVEFESGVARGLKGDLSANAPNVSTTEYDPGQYYICVEITGWNYSFTIYEGFTLVAVNVPVISGAAVSDATPTESEDFTITAICTNAPTTFEAVINGKSYTMVRSGVTTTYSVLVNGRAVGGLDVAHGIFLVAQNAYGADSDSTLSVTVSTVTTNPVTLVLGHLNASWNASNVTKPRLVDGGTDGGRYSAQEGDVVKVYRSKRPNIRTPHVERNRRETREDFVTLDIYTASGRARYDALQGEIERVLNGVCTAPGGGYRKLWSNGASTPAEYPDLIRGMVEVELWKILKLNAT